MHDTETHRLRSALTLTAALAMIAAPSFAADTHSAPAPGLQVQSQVASQEMLDSLRVQVDGLDALAARQQRAGARLDDELARQLREIFADLASLQELQRRALLDHRTGGVAQADADDLADRIARMRLRLRGLATTQQPPEPSAAMPYGAAGAPADTGSAEDVERAPTTPITIPAGTQVVLRLQGWLNSHDAQVGDRFEAALLEPLRIEGRAAIPAGAVFEGHVREVKQAHRPSKGGELKLSIDTLIGGGGERYPVQGVVVAADRGELKGKGNGGSKALNRGLLGALIGGLVGGGKGALIGLGVGATGAVVASKGEEVDLPPDSQLRVRFEGSVDVKWTWKAEPEVSQRR